MTQKPAHEAAGQPTGGQFAKTKHSDAVTSLDVSTRRPELDGWPASLPEPEVTFHMGDDNVITTSVSIDGEQAFDFWNPGDDVHSTESDDFVTEALADEDLHAAAKAWAADKHNEIADALRTEMHTAVERSRASIMAQATGVPVPQSDEDLEKIAEASFITYNAVQRDGELASTALIARGVLKDYPDAAYIGLQVEGADNGDYVSGLVVYNEAKEALGSYDEADLHLEDLGSDEPAKPRGEAFLRHLTSLEATPLRSHWQQYSPMTYDDFDEYAIDVRKAAAWTPGGAA